ncbi:hypothetical protein BKA93DRAFT_753412 [Sparassis latifolia]
MEEANRKLHRNVLNNEVSEEIVSETRRTRVRNGSPSIAVNIRRHLTTMFHPLEVIRLEWLSVDYNDEFVSSSPWVPITWANLERVEQRDSRVVLLHASLVFLRTWTLLLLTTRLVIRLRCPVGWTRCAAFNGASSGDSTQLRAKYSRYYLLLVYES